MNWPRYETDCAGRVLFLQPLDVEILKIDTTLRTTFIPVKNSYERKLKLDAKMTAKLNFLPDTGK